MSRLLGLRARVRAMLHRDEADARAAEEMQFHLDMEVERLTSEGLSPADARRQALASFGGVAGYRDAMRAEWRVPFVEDLWRDARLAIRGLRRDLLFAVVAVSTLAVGIGLATTMAAVANAVRLDERMVRRADDVVVLWKAPASRPADHLPLTFAELQGYRSSSRVSAATAGVIFQGATGVVVTDGPRTLSLGATWVTGDFFQVLGVQPVVGRLLAASDDAVGAEPVAVVSYTTWQQEFGGSADVVSRAFDFGGRRHRIVGVLPRGFEFPRNAGVWMPVLPSFPATQEAGRRGPDVMVFDAVVRVTPGVSTEAARRDFDDFLRRTDGQRAASERGAAPVVQPLTERISGTIRPTLAGASVAVGLLLVIASVNVANLLLIRGGRRGQELAIRHALGAGRLRLIRQLLAESAVLSVLGGVGGVGLAWVGTWVVRAMAPAALPHRELIGVDGRTLAMAGLVTLAATVISGLLPAVVAARGSLSRALRAGSSTAGARAGSHRLRYALVAGQIGIAVVVLAAAGLVTRSLLALQEVPLGFDATRLVVLETALIGPVAATRETQVAVQADMLARLARVPGVQAVGAMAKPPFAAEGGWLAPVTAETQTAAAAAANPFVDLDVVTDRFFDALTVPIVAGRAFDARDREDSPGVTAVSASLARRLWPTGQAVGQRMKLGPPDGGGPWLTVIGVVGDTRFRELQTARPTLYLPARQFKGPVPMTIALRTTASNGPTLDALRQSLGQVHPDLRVVSAGTFGDRIRAPLARPRFSAALFTAFGVATLVLCVVGIYGAIGATVRERRHELGIRLALGEPPRSVRARVMRLGALLMLAGVSAGLIVALWASQYMASLLFSVAPADPGALAVAVGLVAIAALTAAWIPARRAAAVDPVLALRDAAT